MRALAIDLGSNSVKYTAAQVESSGIIVLDEDERITRISQDLEETGRLSPKAMARTIAALGSFLSLHKEIDQIICVATAGLRGAENAQQFVDRVKTELGLDIRIIDGLEEAALAFRAPAQRLSPAPVLVVDIGGRSTELVSGVFEKGEAQIRERVSLPLGAVRMTERFLKSDPPSQTELNGLQHEVKAALEDAPELPAGAKLVGSAGTIIALMGLSLGAQDIKLVLKRIDSGERTLKKEVVDALLHRLSAQPAKDRLCGSIIPKGRADVVVAGAAILSSALARYEANAIEVHCGGLRMGLLQQLRADRARLL